MTNIGSWIPETGCSEECAEHTGSVSNFYCTSHNALACGNCLVEYHSTCNVEFISDAARKYVESDEIKQAQEKADKLGKLIEEPQMSVYDKALEDIKKFRSEINTYLDAKELDLVTKLDEMKQKDEDEHRAEFDTIKTEFGKLKKVIDQRSKDKIIFYLNSKKINDPIDSLEKLNTRFNSLMRKSEMLKVEFVRNSTLQDIILSEDNNFGELTYSSIDNTVDDITNQFVEPTAPVMTDVLNSVGDSLSKSIEPTAPGLTDVLNLNGGATSLAVETNKETNVTAAKFRLDGMDIFRDPMPDHFVHKIIRSRDPIRMRCLDEMDNDSLSDYCAITGIEILGLTQLIATDRQNKAVKICDVIKRKVISKLRLPWQPFDVAVISETKAVVTAPFEKSLQFITIGDRSQMTIDTSLKTDKSCFGISYNRDKLAVSYCSPGGIDIMNLQGDVLRTIATDDSRNRLFEWPRYILLTDDSVSDNSVVEAIYVSDEFKKRVTKLSLDGEIMFSIQQWNGWFPFTPKGIAMLGFKHILVCYYGRGRNEVHIVSRTGKKIRALANNEVRDKTPQTVTFIWNRKQIYISHCGDSFSCKDSYNVLDVYAFI